MKTPTEKQIKYARLIANCLKYSLPEEFSKQAYWKFINDHIDEYNNRIDDIVELYDAWGYFDGLNEFLNG